MTRENSKARVAGWAQIAFGVSALLTSVSCGGRNQIGLDSNKETATGPAGAGGASASGAAGSTSGGSMTTTAGGSITTTSGGGSIGAAGSGPDEIRGGAGGSGTVDSNSRCGFSPFPQDKPEAVSYASPAVVWKHVARFVTGNDLAPPSDLPLMTSAAWARDLALSMLRDDEAQGLAPSAFMAPLERWFAGADPRISSWAQRMNTQGGTLSTLVAGPSPAADAPRLGIFTERFVLQSHPDISSRGHLLNQTLFCSAPPSHPVGLDPFVIPTPAMVMTRRQAYQAYVSQNSVCVPCHQNMDTIGASLEHFDELGAFRKTDNGLPVDSSGVFLGTTARYGFNSIDDLAPQLAVSCEVAHCFASQMMHQAFEETDLYAETKQYSEAQLNVVADQFANANFSLRELILAIVQSDPFLR